MRYFLLIFPLLFALTSCHPRLQETDTISERGPDSIYAAYLVMARSLPDSLSRVSPFIITSADTGDIDAEVQQAPYLAVGDILANGRTYALYCSNLNDTNAITRLYRYRQNRWHASDEDVLPFFVNTVKIRRLGLNRNVEFSGIKTNQKVSRSFQYDAAAR